MTLDGCVLYSVLVLGGKKKLLPGKSVQALIAYRLPPPTTIDEVEPKMQHHFMNYEQACLLSS